MPRIAALAVLGALLTAGLAPLAPASASPLPAPLAAAVSAPVVPSTGGAGFGLQPARNDRPDTRADFTYSGTPGASVPDEVAVVNLGLKPVTLKIYATDATSNADGTFALIPSAQKPRDLGTWITIQGPGTVTVPARTKKGPSYTIVHFDLAIPRSASPGDHAGGIVVSLAGNAVNPQGVKIKLDQRVGARVYIRVSGTVHAAMAIENPKIDFAGPSLFGNPFGDGTAHLSYTVHNTGNVILGGKVTATVSPWLGSSSTVTLPLVPPLLPGTSTRVSVPTGIAVFPGIHISATIRLTPTAPAGGADPQLSVVSASASTWAIPWELLVLVLLVIAGLGALGWRIRQNRRPNPNAPTSHAHRRSSALSKAGTR